MVERDSTVTLRIVDDENVRAVVDLSVTEEQQAFVAANVFSLAQAFATQTCGSELSTPTTRQLVSSC